LLQVLLEDDCLAVGFLNPRVLGKDLKSRAETRENSVCPYHAFIRETGHPSMNATRQLFKYVAPLADLNVATAVTRTAHNMYR
jgi:hypothetical protein